MATEAPTQPVAFSPNPRQAQQLGFISISLSGSRAYEYSRADYPTSCDWDLIGLVEGKRDILDLLLHRREELWNLLEIVQPEQFPWEIIEQTIDGQDIYDEDWEVVRFSGWTRDGSKRSLKLWSRQHLHTISTNPTVCRFGVLSAKSTRKIRSYHPRSGSRLFVFQPTRIADNLSILVDVDFLTGDDDPQAFGTGVTCDLFLSSCTLFEQSPGSVRPLKQALMRKWCDLADEPDVGCLIAQFHGHEGFDTGKLDSLRIDLTSPSSPTSSDATWSSSSSPTSSLATSPTTSDSSNSQITFEAMDCRRANGYVEVNFLPIQRKEIFKSQQGESVDSTSLPHLQVLSKEDLEFRMVSEKYYPSCFTSNSEGSFGEIRTREAGPKPRWSEWRPVFVKKGPYVDLELMALPKVHMYFPSTCLQQLIAFDNDTQALFYSLVKGKTLNQVRLDYCLGDDSSLNNHQGQGERTFLDTVNWFLDFEMKRSEHVLDTYSRTIEYNPDSVNSANQSIHRFYFTRLLSDSRFLAFYSERCLDILGIQTPKPDFTTTDFWNTPLIINGITYPPLRYHFDRATDLLDPTKAGGLADLPVAFGLGDGHGGNIMVARMSSIYNDAFFNVLYADLLSEDISKSSPTNNRSGATVSWDVLPEVIDINYELRVDTIGKSVAIAKLEYVLLPMFEMMNQHDPQMANQSLDVLSSALFACALLSRNFRERPDVFFLNLAVGVRLVTEMKEVLSEAFGWGALYMAEPPNIYTGSSDGLELQLLPRATEIKSSPTQWQGDLDTDFLAFLFSSDLLPDDVFLKRAGETYQLQQRFSKTEKESEGTIMRRISKARRDGMAISPHTCIRESIFAEPRIDHHFAYSRILAESENDKSKLLVDAGCCMGTDIRKLVLDGFPPENILGLDIENRYFDVGRTLYNEDLMSTKLRFRKADMTDPKFATKYPELKSRFHFVHSANVIHLFGMAEQEVFFRNLVHLVAPGGTIWGRQVGLIEGFNSGYRQPEGKGARFTINEFREMALRVGDWAEHDVQYEGQLVKYDEIRAQRKDKEWVLQWSIRIPVNKEGGKGDMAGPSTRIIEEV
ncbi:hypothetical protein N7513_002211 [Penicillium frequentans]|nr:hypothetical protein N7513_002211 [Penicillium glabrum]